MRLLAPSSGMLEEPITGSLNAAIACWLQSIGKLDRDLPVCQGICAGREGRVFIRRGAAGRIPVGGQSHVLISGELQWQAPDGSFDPESRRTRRESTQAPSS